MAAVSPASVDGLREKHFYRVRTLQELAAYNAIGILCVNNIRATEPEVYKLLVQLNLPSPVYDTIRPLVWPLCKTVKDWYNHQFLGVRSNLSQPSVGQFVAKHGLHIMWCGVLDCDKMTELIVREESYGVAERFAIACEYSFLTDVLSLWLNLTDYEREDQDRDNELVKYWKAKLRGDIGAVVNRSHQHTELDYGMNVALTIGNLSSIKYFWNKMSEQDRSRKIVLFAKIAFGSIRSSTCYYQSCVVPFFLLQIPYGKQRKVVLEDYLVFISLLDCLFIWPWQNLVARIIRCFVRYSSQSNMLDCRMMHLMSTALLNMGKGDFINTDLERVALYIWSLMSYSRKDEFFGSSIRFEQRIGALLASESRRCIAQVFNSVGSESLQRLAFTGSCAELVCQNMKSENWNVVKLVVKYLLPRNLQAVERFQQKVGAYLVRLYETDTVFPIVTSADVSSFAIKLEQITKQHIDGNESTSRTEVEVVENFAEASVELDVI